MDEIRRRHAMVHGGSLQVEVVHMHIGGLGYIGYIGLG